MEYPNLNTPKITTDMPKKELLVKVTRPSGLRVMIKKSLAIECLNRPGWEKGWSKRTKKKNEVTK